MKFLDVLAIRVNLVDAAGQDCVTFSSGASMDLGVFGKVVPQTALLESGPVGDRRWNTSCKAGGKLYLKVTRVGDAFAAQALPLELAFRLEPAVTNPGPPAVDELAPHLPPPASAKPAEIDGGTSFNDAPRLEPGTYTETVGSGETRFYRVRLGWGQRLAYRIGIPSQPGLGLQAGALNATIASPLRQQAEQTIGSDSSILVGGSTDQELSGSTAVPVRYANRDSLKYQAKPYSIDGDYYLILDLSYPVGSEVPFSLPLTITLATEGGGPGPTYASDPVTQGTTPTTAAAAPPARAEAASGRAGWVLAAAVAVIAVIAVVAAVAVLAWRRRRAQRAR